MSNNTGVTKIGLIAALLFTTECTGSNSTTHLTGPYLGQTPPGLTAIAFAPGIISTSGWEYSAIFTPDMATFYYIREVSTDDKSEQQLASYQYRNGVWQPAAISPRVGTPTFSTDGNTMYFGRGYKTRQQQGWSEMQRLSPALENIRIMRVTASNNGTLAIDEANNNGVLRYSRLVNGQRQAPTPFPKQINTGQFNAHPFIAPDESYVIWDGQRNSDTRNADLFISFKRPDGSWGKAIKFGSEINTGASEFAAMITPDGKYLFFNRNIGPDNTDIFWIDAQIIEQHRPKF